jgi:hypothetical protein
MIDFGLYATYFLILVAIVAAAAFPLKYLFQNLNEAKGAFIGIGALLLIAVLGYVFASSDYTFKGMEAFNITTGTVKMVGGGLNTLYILIAIATVSTIYFESTKFFK